MSSEDRAAALLTRFPDLLRGQEPFRGEVTLDLLNAEAVVDVCRTARDDFGFNFLLDLTSVDQYGEDPRWMILYELCGIDHGQHLRLRTWVTEDRSELPSVCSVWRTADWHEREAFDLMGIRFRGHPDLRRIIMWEGYPYHPLRKDFPLAGRPSEMPGVAFSEPAPLAGGPFVTVTGAADATSREPRARSPQSHA